MILATILLYFFFFTTHISSILGLYFFSHYGTDLSLLQCVATVTFMVNSMVKQHCHLHREENQLDATECFIARSTCFGHWPPTTSNQGMYHVSYSSQ